MQSQSEVKMNNSFENYRELGKCKFWGRAGNEFGETCKCCVHSVIKGEPRIIFCSNISIFIATQIWWGDWKKFQRIYSPLNLRFLFRFGLYCLSCCTTSNVLTSSRLRSTLLLSANILHVRMSANEIHQSWNWQSPIAVKILLFSFVSEQNVTFQM